MAIEITTAASGENPPPPPIQADSAPHENGEEHRPPPRRGRPPKSSYATPADRAEREVELRENQSLRDWLDVELAGHTDIKCNIFRKSPRVAPNGANVYGSLETVEERIDEDYIREMWGGGVYSIMIQIPRADGSGKYRIWRKIQVALAGPPKMQGVVQEAGAEASAPATPATPAPGSSIVERAFESMERREREAQERMFREDRHQGMDARSLSAITDPIVAQLSEAQKTIRELQVRLVDQANKPPPRDEFRDQLMRDVITGDRSEAEKVRRTYEDRLEDQRRKYEDRIDRLIEEHSSQVKRLEDRHADDLRRIEARHERELHAAEKMSDNSGTATKMAFEARLEGLKETIARLERELTAATAKIATLEARKDQTIAEKADELLKVQETLEGLSAGAAGEKDERWYEKVIGAIGNSEAAVRVLNRIAGGPPDDQAAQQQQQQMMQLQAAQQQLGGVPVGTTFVAGDGRPYVMTPQGPVPLEALQMRQQIARARKKKKAQAGDAAQAADAGDAGELADLEAEAAGGPPPVVGRVPTEDEIGIAVTFMENALKARDADPATFARGAGSLIPGDLLQFIMQFESIDQFLNQHCKLSAGSPLATVRGRQFAREVHKFLKTGSI